MDIKFRDTESLIDIQSLLRGTTAQETIVWQTHSKTGQRIKYCVSEFDFIEPAQTVELKLKDFKNDLDMYETIYIKLSFRDTVFKADIINIRGDMLSIFVPIHVKTQELRSFARKKFKPKDDKVVTFSMANDITFGARQSLSFQVVDISQIGVCILISDKNKQLIETSDELYITQLGAFELPEPVQIDLKYLSRIRFRSKGKTKLSNRAGISFSQKIPENFLNDFYINNL